MRSVKARTEGEHGEMTMLWRGCDKYDPREAQHSITVKIRKASKDDECSIYQEPIQNVKLDMLPTDWGPSVMHANMIVLPCQHVFNINALTIHYLSNGMACPICRQGDANSCLQVQSLPLAMQDVFTRYMQDFVKRNEEDEGETLDASVYYDHEQLRQAFRVHIFTNDEQITSTIRGLVDNEAENDVTLQRGFLRHLSRIQLDPNRDVCLRIQITHPLLPQSPPLSTETPFFVIAKDVLQRFKRALHDGYEHIHINCRLILPESNEVHVIVGHVELDIAGRLPQRKPDIDYTDMVIRNFKVKLCGHLLMAPVLTHLDNIVNMLYAG